MAAIAATMMTRLNRRNVILDPSVDTGVLGGRYVEQESGGVVSYRVKRLPLAMIASFVAGNMSSLLGIGGGVIKVPVLNAWCGVPLRAAAATSAFMIGVTATAGRDHLLRPRAAHSGAGRGGGAGRAARFVARHAAGAEGPGQVAEAADGRRPGHRRHPDVREAAMSTSRLEGVISIVLRTGVVTSSVCLGVGLALSLIGAGELSRLMLNVGVIVLLATPVVRVLVSIAEYVSERDWGFVMLTAVVLAELAASAVAALLFNRKL